MLDGLLGYNHGFHIQISFNTSPKFKIKTDPNTSGKGLGTTKGKHYFGGSHLGYRVARIQS